MLKGIDVSYHQGKIDWDSVEPWIDFAILRAGYGSKTVDSMFNRNSSECERLGIPYGVYWFSYARNVNEAITEAKKCLETIKDKHLSFPVCFDFEYDSDNSAISNGYKLNNKDREVIARAFLETIESNGYYAMFYTNKDYLNKGFSALIDRFDMWLAQWTSKGKPDMDCGIWQSGQGTIPGINGRVDINTAYKDYPAMLSGTKKNPVEDIRIYLKKINDLLTDLDHDNK